MITRILLLALLLISLPACNRARADALQGADGTSDRLLLAAKPKPKDKPQPMAAPSADSPKVEKLPYTRYFNGASAYQDMQNQVDFGFRIAGSPAANKCRGYLINQLKQSCSSVESQLFTVKRGTGDLKMCNILGHINPQAKRRILLVAHWDTRPTADMNPQGKRNQPIPGANDGASGVAVLLELARVFKAHPPKIGVDILLTDGEDYGPQTTMMFLGAKYFADNLKPEQISSYNYGILLDMIGDRDLDIHPEAHSQESADRIYQSAAELSQDMGYKVFKLNGGYEILDDHLPIMEKGIRIYDFIDFNYRYWHTTEDTMDKCHPDSLEAVGRTLENMIYLQPNLYDELEPLAPNAIGGGWR
jgi:hypothetical protein